MYLSLGFLMYPLLEDFSLSLWRSISSTSLRNWHFMAFLHRIYWIEDPHVLHLSLVMWGRFSGLVSILDVCNEVRLSPSGLLYLRTNSLALHFIHFSKIPYLISYNSIFRSFRYSTACPVCILFGVGSLFSVWLSSAWGK